VKHVWLHELFRQWVEVRGRRTAPACRGFRVDWNELLNASGLCSAEDRKIAFREAETEETQGHIRLHRHKRRRNIVLKIEVPVASESWLLRRFETKAPTELQAASLAEVDRAARRPHLRFPQLWSDWCGRLRIAFELGKSLRPIDWHSPDVVRALLEMTHAFTSREPKEGSLVREVSVDLGLKSKDLEKRRRTLEACLRQMFGREMPLETFGVVLTDSRADLGGLLTLHFPSGEKQVFDRLRALYTLSFADLKRAHSATTTASRVLTVENTKTTLRRLIAADEAQSTLIAGCSFPSKALIRLLELLPRDLPVYHFGDTDPAGFQILATLREKAPQPVRPFLMLYRTGEAKLTEYDRGLLPGLLANPSLADVRADLTAMDTSGLKGDFEQETIGLPQLHGWPFFNHATV